MGAQRARIAVIPHLDQGIVEAIERGGGEVAALDVANAVVWTDPFNASALGEALEQSDVTWVQLPFAGIEAFFAEDVIDPSYVWTCTKGVYGHATAEQALALMLMAARSLHRHVNDRTWVFQGGDIPHRSLAGRGVVVVGTGGIGRGLAAMLQPLRTRIVGVNRTGTPMPGAEKTVASGQLRQVLPEADFVVLAAALTPETRHVIDRAAFARMRSGAWLINVARGGLVDHDALLEALTSGRIAGAALDVTEPEPLPDGHPLWELENVVITPHVANTWEMGLPELRAMVERNVGHFSRGEELEGLVDPAAGY